MVRVRLPDKSIKECGSESKSIEEILILLGINPIEVIVARNGKIAPEDDIASGNDDIRVYRIVHGG